MTKRLILVRHPAVCESLRGVCYGASDVNLSQDGLRRIPSLITELLERAAEFRLYHSGLSRCQQVSEALAKRVPVLPVADHRLRERHFGEWELRTWEEIYAESGDAMSGMVTAPDRWSPPGGESTFQLRDRVMEWYAELPEQGTMIAITHGGPIAALRGTLMNLPVKDWLNLVPRPGEVVEIPLSAQRSKSGLSF